MDVGGVLEPLSCAVLAGSCERCVAAAASPSLCCCICGRVRWKPGGAEAAEASAVVFGCAGPPLLGPLVAAGPLFRPVSGGGAEVCQVLLLYGPFTADAEPLHAAAQHRRSVRSPVNLHDLRSVQR